MDKAKRDVYIVIAVTFGVIIYVSAFMPIKVGEQIIPTVINGVTSSMSIIIGFSGAFIGIMLREIKKDKKMRQFYVISMVLLLMPLMFLWTIYSVLTSGFYELAIRYGLTALITTLCIFFVIMIYTVRELFPEALEKVKK